MDTKHCIQRNRLDPILTPEILHGYANRIEVVLAVAGAQTYNDKEPHFIRLLKALYSLPAGTVIRPQELYNRADLTLAQFKEAKRNRLVRAFFRDHVQTKGGGVNTTYLIVESKGA